MTFRSKITNDMIGGAGWKVGRLQSARQHDGHSCGAFVMLVRKLQLFILYQQSIKDPCEHEIITNPKIVKNYTEKKFIAE